jgi:hypothetical protein
MLALVLIVLVWIALPFTVYRMVTVGTGSVAIALVAAASSALIAVVGLERGFRRGKAFLKERRRHGAFR